MGKNKSKNRKNIIVISGAVLILLALLFTVLFALRGNQQPLTIINESDHGYAIIYYSSLNGQWMHAQPFLNKADVTKAVLHNRDALHPANYQVAILEKGASKFYCSANIVQPTFGRKAVFIHHDGRCRLIRTHDGDLSLIIDKQ